MIQKEFNQSMIDMLKKVKGSNFLSFECDLEANWNRTYGYLRINTSSISFNVSNEQKEMDLFGESEDVACFSFSNVKKSLKDDFHLINSYSSKEFAVNETIESVFTISEKIQIGNDEEVLDMGFILKTPNHIYTFSRENWFDEFIYINIDKDFGQIYPIAKDIENWKRENETDPVIERFIVEI